MSGEVVNTLRKGSAKKLMRIIDQILNAINKHEEAMYKVTESHDFQTDLYPEVEKELVLICKQLQAVKGGSKRAIVISFLKDHTIGNEFLKDNAEVVDLLTSGRLNAVHTEALFNVCRDNRIFLYDFERYIASMLRRSQ